MCTGSHPRRLKWRGPSHSRPTRLSATSNRRSSWNSKQKDAPAFQARCAYSNNSSDENTSCFSMTWSADDCAQWLKLAAILHSSCTVSARPIDGKLKSAVESMRSKCRGVAQPGSAPALGAGGPRFKSGRPDHSSVRGPSLRSGFRLRAPTPAIRLKFKSGRPDH